MGNVNAQEMHDEAWELLESKGLSLGEMMKVRSSFIDWSGYKDQYPFIVKMKRVEYEDCYHSTHEPIKDLMFLNLNEAILANAIYLNMDNASVGREEFIQMFRFTCRIIGIDSIWA